MPAGRVSALGQPPDSAFIRRRRVHGPHQTAATRSAASTRRVRVASRLGVDDAALAAVQKKAPQAPGAMSLFMVIGPIE